MCCRLQLDLRELLKRGNGLFGSAEQTGSLGVVTINCARLGYLYAGDEAGCWPYRRLLDWPQEQPGDQAQGDPAPHGQRPVSHTKRYLGTLRNHFSTLGVNGINEMIRNFTDDLEDITTEGGEAFALRFLDHMRARIVEIPGRDRPPLQPGGHAGRRHHLPLCQRKTAKRFADILQAGPGMPYYTNSSQLPVGFTDDPVRGAGNARRPAIAIHRRHRCCTCTWASACRLPRPARNWFAAL